MHFLHIKLSNKVKAHTLTFFMQRGVVVCDGYVFKQSSLSFQVSSNSHLKRTTVNTFFLNNLTKYTQSQPFFKKFSCHNTPSHCHHHLTIVIFFSMITYYKRCDERRDTFYIRFDNSLVVWYGVWCLMPYIFLLMIT